MYHSSNCRSVNQPVKRLPPFPAHPPDHFVCRCHCKRYQQYKRGKPGSDEGTLGNVFKNIIPLKKLVEPDIGHEMQADIKEPKQTEHAAEIY